jgi:hypothetical protein
VGHRRRRSSSGAESVKGVPARFVSVRPAAAAKASSEGWRLCLRPNREDDCTYIIDNTKKLNGVPVALNHFTYTLDKLKSKFNE